ncbi:hypothetical protein MF672_041780 [Actinomadura sp. ATCC 31491]|uniref:Uncharacterized protein n=1 Tax=Actinomadura luzonensis TaxID=2805427 RepID=A0ABT0G6Q0_9ACTN|nr:hypothetical protein [Actinomadura luzonensis]MCK2220287.1 hypothetical protein [Actinomadura luzonensis]
MFEALICNGRRRSGDGRPLRGRDAGRAAAPAADVRDEAGAGGLSGRRGAAARYLLGLPNKFDLLAPYWPGR